MASLRNSLILLHYPVSPNPALRSRELMNLLTFFSRLSTWPTRDEAVIGNGRKMSSIFPTSMRSTGRAVSFVPAVRLVSPNPAGVHATAFAAPLVLEPRLEASSSCCSILMLAAELDPGEGMCTMSSELVSLSEMHSSSPMMTTSTSTASSAEDESVAPLVYVQCHMNGHLQA